MAGEKAKGGKRGRKHGRNKVFCQRYKLEGREDKNREKKVARDKRQKKAAAKREARILAGKPVHRPSLQERSRIQVANGSWSVN